MLLLTDLYTLLVIHFLVILQALANTLVISSRIFAGSGAETTDLQLLSKLLSSCLSQ